MVKVSVNRFVSSSIENLRNDVKAETQRLRNRTSTGLRKSNVAAKVARGEIGHQRINGKMRALPIRLNDRKRWLCVAKHVALTMRAR